MQTSSGIGDTSWIWGIIWVFYALFYGRYFTHMANRLKPDLDLVDVPGSPERLRARSAWCRRFALFMLIPTTLELVRSTDFTSATIAMAPCLFGLWVMRAVWSEVFRSQVPKAKERRKAENADVDLR